MKLITTKKSGKAIEMISSNNTDQNEPGFITLLSDNIESKTKMTEERKIYQKYKKSIKSIRILYISQHSLEVYKTK